MPLKGKQARENKREDGQKGMSQGKGQGFPRPCNYDKVQSHAERGLEETYLVQPEAAEGSFHGQKVAQGGGAADVGRVGGVALHIPRVEDGHGGLSTPAYPQPWAASSSPSSPLAQVFPAGRAGWPHGVPDPMDPSLLDSLVNPSLMPQHPR